jgi:hypothetical protein
VKSFPTDIKVHGLRPFSSTAKNTGHMITARNVREKKWGLEGYVPYFSLLPAITISGGGSLDMTVDWPFPQIWQTDTGLWIGTRAGLYQVVFTASVWTATLRASATVTWPWTIADCPMFPVFASGDTFVYYDYDTSAWITYTGLNSGGTHWSTSWKPPIATTFHKGQIVTVGSITATTAPSDSRVIRWSEIGAFRFLGKTATAHKNEAGFAYAPVDDKEMLLRALPLGDNIIVYGTFACYSMKPVIHPAPTFGIDAVRAIGIANPLAVGGNDKKHLLVARDGTLWLWAIAKDKVSVSALEKVGYSEYLSVMQRDIDMSTGHGIVSVVYNEQEDEFYISDGVTGFIYTEDGLTETGKMFTSMVDYTNAMVTALSDFSYISNVPLGVFIEKDEESIVLQTDILDQGMSAIKMIETVEILGTLPEGAQVEVMVEMRATRDVPFRSTQWLRCNRSGTCSPVVSGSELRVNVRISEWKGATIEGIRIWWKMTDRRYIRGRYDDNISYNRPGGK